MINPQFSIKINGVQDPAWDADIVEIVVDTSVYLPAMCTILLRDQQLVPGLPAFSHTDNMLAMLDFGCRKAGIVEHAEDRGRVIAVARFHHHD